MWLVRASTWSCPPGKAKILDSVREVVALHRDRYVFPIKIMVTKSQGSGADATFMGLLKVRCPMVCYGVWTGRRGDIRKAKSLGPVNLNWPVPCCCRR